ncbi:MAG: phosphate ABC transporter permease PstC, partial [Gemmatimonadetes bacterium]|nr:phosphate ABC transporter permease PstC [Gemmatimonadota bacterium]
MTEPATSSADRAPLASPEAPPPSTLAGASGMDRVYALAITGFALCVPALLVGLFIEVGAAGWPALKRFGFAFLFSSEWDPVREQFGVAPAVIGTLLTSAIALTIATPLALGVAIYVAEFAPDWLRTPLAFLVDLLAAIPSVVYGLWGVFVLVPVMRTTVMPFLRDTLHL